jgi:hypothetical protein
MAATRRQGITVDTNGNFTIDKEHRGVRICLRLGRWVNGTLSNASMLK